MILSAVRRFGLALAGARAGWWRWLIAALVVLLVSVPVAGAAAPVGRAPATGGYQRGPLARAAQAQSVAVAIVVELAKGALNKAGSAGFGWVLDQFGLGDGLEGEIGGIRDRLGEIQNHLTALETAVTQLRAEVAQSEYSDLVAQTSPITADIDHAWRRLDQIARMTNSDSTATQKANFTRETQTFIHSKLMGSEQEQLAKRISGEVGGDGLIKAFSKATKTRSGCCWTDRTSEDVRKVFDYYQLQEARLLTMRVEYMHTHLDTYSEAIIKKDIETVKQDLETQEKDLLKPSAPCCVSQNPFVQRAIKDSPSALIADPRTNLIWNTAYLGVKILSWQAPYIEKAVRERGGWRLATVAEVQQFIRGWQESKDANWEVWLDRLAQVGGRIPSLKTDSPSETFGYSYPSAGYTGLWTYRCPGCAQPTAVSALGAEESPPPASDQLRGLLFVKERTENYWW